MRDRTKEVEKLKKQLQQLQEIVGGDPSTMASSEQEYTSGGRSPASSEGTPAPPISEPVLMPTSTTGTENLAHDYMNNWPHSQPEQLSGLGLVSDADTPMAFDSQNTYFSHAQSRNDVVPELATSSLLGRRARAVTTGVAPSSIQHHSAPRSHSMSAAYPSNGSSPINWAVSSTEGHDSLSMSAT
jgi:hypothetical protein